MAVHVENGSVFVVEHDEQEARGGVAVRRATPRRVDESGGADEIVRQFPGMLEKDIGLDVEGLELRRLSPRGLRKQSRRKRGAQHVHTSPQPPPKTVNAN